MQSQKTKYKGAGWTTFVSPIGLDLVVDLGAARRLELRRDIMLVRMNSQKQLRQACNAQCCYQQFCPRWYLG
jgi:hypothetical protein